MSPAPQATKVIEANVLTSSSDKADEATTSLPVELAQLAMAVSTKQEPCEATELAVSAPSTVAEDAGAPRWKKHILRKSPRASGKLQGFLD